MLVSTSSSFAAIDHKWHFRKTLTQIFKFGCFGSSLVPRLYLFKKNELDFLMQNLMLNRLASISNPKKEKEKSWYAIFYLLLFTLSLVSLNKGFFLFFSPFWTFVKWYLSFIYTALENIYTLENRATTVYMGKTVCKTTLLICFCFWRRNLQQIKEHQPGKPLLISKKRFLVLLR